MTRFATYRGLAMWQLVSAQFRYYWFWMVPSLAALLAFALLVEVNSEGGESVTLWAIVVSIGGVVLNAVLWFFDLKERRQLLWSPLPVRRSTPIAARMAVGGLLVSFLWLAASLAIVARAGSVAPILGGLLTLAGAHAIGLIFAAWVFLYEEVNALLLGRPVAWWILQVAVIGFMSMMVATADFGEPPGGLSVLAAYLVAAVGAVVAAALHRRRDSLLVGTDPVRSVPVDWGRR
jgi:hypothetical protein